MTKCYTLVTTKTDKTSQIWKTKKLSENNIAGIELLCTHFSWHLSISKKHYVLPIVAYGTNSQPARLEKQVF